MLADSTINFLTDLRDNNNREWFQANKKRFEAAKNDFTGFVAVLLARLTEFDGALAGTTAADCLFRIYRDVRFSKNKDPYKTAFGAYMAPGGRKSSVPGFYLHLDPSESFIAGGSYCPDSAALFKIRSAIADRFAEFEEIVGARDFVAAFGEIGSFGDALVNVPKPFAKDHPAGKYLRFKSFIATRQLTREDFADMDGIVDDFRRIHVFNEFCRQAIKA